MIFKSTEPTSMMSVGSVDLLWYMSDLVYEYVPAEYVFNLTALETLDVIVELE